MNPVFTPQKWFWQVGDDQSRYWSSEKGSYVASLPADAPLTFIANQEELSTVLRSFGLPVPNGADLNDYKAAFDAHLDVVAQERQYDNRVSIATYAGSTNPAWAGEAQAYIAWRDAALIYMFEQLAAVQAGDIAAPTVEQFIAGIEPIVWPDLPA